MAGSIEFYVRSISSFHSDCVIKMLLFCFMCLTSEDIAMEKDLSLFKIHHCYYVHSAAKRLQYFFRMWLVYRAISSYLWIYLITLSNYVI